MKTITTTTTATFHILHRTGGVYDSFRGPIGEAIAEVALRNATDDTGTTEMVSSFSDESDMIEELAYYMGQLD